MKSQIFILKVNFFPQNLNKKISLSSSHNISIRYISLRFTCLTIPRSYLLTALYNRDTIQSMLPHTYDPSIIISIWARPSKQSPFRTKTAPPTRKCSSPFPLDFRTRGFARRAYAYIRPREPVSVTSGLFRTARLAASCMKLTRRLRVHLGESIGLSSSVGRKRSCFWKKARVFCEISREHRWIE